jgi:hypothetical protein
LIFYLFGVYHKRKYQVEANEAAGDNLSGFAVIHGS